MKYEYFSVASEHMGSGIDGGNSVECKSFSIRNPYLQPDEYADEMYYNYQLITPFTEKFKECFPEESIEKTMEDRKPLVFMMFTQVYTPVDDPDDTCHLVHYFGRDITDKALPDTFLELLDAKEGDVTFDTPIEELFQRFDAHNKRTLGETHEGSGLQILHIEKCCYHISVSQYHGNFIYNDGRLDNRRKRWYVDDDVVVDTENPRPCPRCGREIDPDDPVDPCLGHIPGIVNACCGHGTDRRYFQNENGVTTYNKEHLWWSVPRVPGLDNMLKENDHPIIEKDDFLYLRPDLEYGKAYARVFFAMTPIAQIPWKTRIPRLTYPEGSDNVSRLQRYIDDTFNRIEDDQIHIMNRDDAILVAWLYDKFKMPIDLEKEVSQKNHIRTMQAAWIYDERFFQKPEFEGDYPLRFRCPIGMNGLILKYDAPQNPRYIYVTIHGCDDRPSDETIAFLDKIREHLMIILV